MSEIEKPEARRPAVRVTPEGWWNLRDLSGPVNAVCAAVQSAEKVPDYFKSAIVAEIKAQCGADYNAVFVDAHFVTGSHGAILHLTIAPAKQLT